MAEEMVDTNQAEKVEAQQSGLSQEEFDKALNKRIARERENFAKALGIETYSEETVKTFLESITAKDTKLTEYEQAQAKLQTEMRDRDFKIHAMTSGIGTEYVDKAIRLASLEMETNSELDMAKAFENVLADFPMFQSTTTKPSVKIGDTVDTKVDTTTEIDRYLENKYKNSKYFNK